ncbi:hypothetical protein LR48_Vigan06g089900 [Vigna angularis]|uniref:Uncharacterized protein n=1 Tax=Phaseolus angularis TaxID=3914 RepID=A0A0L9US69_PHAAN|nr:hypothetical protein LR48_Vigan06g089900 [Vigna angularis]
MKLMKEVKKDRDGIKRGHKKCKRGENASTAQRQLPLSGTLKDPLAPLRGEMPLRGRMEHSWTGFMLNFLVFVGFEMKLMKEVKKDRDGIKRGHKKCKRGENASTAQRQLPLSGTLKDPLAPLRGEMPLRGRMEHAVSLSGNDTWSYRDYYLIRFGYTYRGVNKRHFKVVQDRRLLMERKAGLIPNLAPQFGEQLENRNWGRLATYPAPANIAVVNEFYINARSGAGARAAGASTMEDDDDDEFEDVEDVEDDEVEEDSDDTMG